MIAVHPDHPKATEAFSYLGQTEKVHRSALAVLTGRLRAASIIQGSPLLSIAKTIQLLMVALGLILTASNCHAGLGWTLEQFEQEYGKPVLDQQQIAGRLGYVFTGDDYIIAAFFHNTQVSRVLYICRGGSVFDWGRARSLLMANAPDATWDDPSKNEADNSYRIDGTKGGVESYYASLTGDRQMLAIWTKEDDEAGRVQRGPDTPAAASVAGSGEQGSGEAAAEVASNPDRKLALEKNNPDASADPTPSPPAEGPTSAHSVRPKAARVKPGPSTTRHETFHVAHLDAKARSTRVSHQNAGTIPPAPTPSVMNAGTGLYNSDYTQPFKNSKTAPSP
jgi:hypothetical protein